MENTSRLYNAVVKLLRQPDCWQDLRHLYTLAWMVVGLLISHQISLSAWIDYVYSRAVFAQSTQRRFSRWLSNERVQPQQVYGPLIRQALHQWHSERLVLALDTSLLWQEYCLIQVALVYRGRAIPVVWQVIQHDSSSVGYSEYTPLLDATAKLLPQAAEVLFLADRGFADIALMRQLKRLGWHYRIRVKSNFYVYQAKQGCPVSYYLHHRCQAIFLHSVCVSRKRYGLVHVALAWHSGSNERWYVVSDEVTSAQTFVEYGLRFDIEEGFLDSKSNGFQLEQSQIRSAEMLARLCLILAIAMLYLTSVGTEVVSNGHRRWDVRRAQSSR